MIDTRTLARLSRAAPYDDGAKAKWKRAAMAAMRQMAKDLNLPKGTFSVRWNAGGIAVPGDATLHSDDVYVTIGTDIGESVGFARGVKDRKVYTGGQHCWLIGDWDQWVHITEMALSHGKAMRGAS
jgi:hypothetical protein